jgi:hypothetical protein
MQRMGIATSVTLVVVSYAECDGILCDAQSKKKKSDSSDSRRIVIILGFKFLLPRHGPVSFFFI